MHRSVKALLLSALVFPGAGQFYLRRRLAGCLFALPALAATLYLSNRVLARAQQIMDEIVDGKLAPDLATVLARVHQQSADGTLAPNLALLVMLVCWIGAMAHAWRAGRAPDA